MPENHRNEVLLTPVSLADVRQLSRVFNSAFSRELGTAYLYSYPPEGVAGRDLAIAGTLSYREAFVRRLLCDPSNHIIAARIGAGMAGFGVWTPPKSEPSLRRYIPFHLRLLGILCIVYDKAIALLYPTWLQLVFASSTTREYMRRSALLSASNSQGLDTAIPADITAKGYWTLMILGVSEDYGRRGIGSKLLQWGCDEADKTDRAVVVVASPDGEALYGRRGFQEVGKQTMLEDEAEGLTQKYMIRFPRGQKKGNE